MAILPSQKRYRLRFRLVSWNPPFVKSRNYLAKWPVRLIYQCLMIEIVAPFCNNRVNLAQADSHLPGHFPLGQVGIPAEKLQQTITGFLFSKVVQGTNI